MTRVLRLERPFHAACGGGLGRRRRRAGLRRQQGRTEREEEEAEALRQQAEVGGLAPNEKVEPDLAQELGSLRTDPRVRAAELGACLSRREDGASAGSTRRAWGGDASGGLGGPGGGAGRDGR